MTNVDICFNPLLLATCYVMAIFGGIQQMLCVNAPCKCSLQMLLATLAFFSYPSHHLHSTKRPEAGGISSWCETHSIWRNEVTAPSEATALAKGWCYTISCWWASCYIHRAACWGCRCALWLCFPSAERERKWVDGWESFVSLLHK